MSTVVVLVTHGEAGQAMLAAAEKMVGKIPELATVRMETGEQQASLSARLEDAVRTLATSDIKEVLFLVDLFGSTPMRLCCKSCGANSAVVTGVNLAMLFKLATADRDKPAAELATMLASTGTKSIQVIGASPT